MKNPFSKGPYCLPGTPDNIASFIQVISEWLEQHRIDEHQRHRILISAEEILVNIVTHAYKENPSDVCFFCEITHDLIYLSFEDQGIAFNPTQQADPDVDSDLEDRPVGGLGIFMAKQLAQKISYHRKNNTNILELWFRYEPSLE